MLRRSYWPAVFALLLALPACPSNGGRTKQGSDIHRDDLNKNTGPDLAKEREKGLKRLFEWYSWDASAFAKAKSERRYILLYGAAEWCHWCHVMEDTTYVDPEVGRIIKERFVAIRVDIDSRPDIAERYGDWGWPATILFSPDAEEIGKYRGYLTAPEFSEILGRIDAIHQEVTKGSLPSDSDPSDKVPVIEALGAIGARVMLDMDSYYDKELGGWGMRQKAPLGANAEFELRRYAHGSQSALQRAVFSLEKQRSLIDPVWGGIYQYSAGGSWADPHYEKLMSYQAENIEAYARAYALTKNPAFLEDARKLEKYLSTFLMNSDGAFLGSQDADVGAHDRGVPFVEGAVYYKLDEDRRRALGMPRVDPNVYAYENGLAIAALCALFDAAPDSGVLGRARRAADLLLKTHLSPEGQVTRPLKISTKVRYLADAASFGRGLARLGEITGDLTYTDAAEKIAAAMIADLEDPSDGGYWSHTPDPSAAGVFTRRDKPFVHNVTAARFFSLLAKIKKEEGIQLRAKRALAAISTPRRLEKQGRMVGQYLLALDDAGVIAW